ncbi:hypothetical protein [Rhizobium sp. PDO1-076]|uniref:hypothetical protein n=1 Tax=Rhizobium sp. PDO1-076 TaxID=1125979 RepID=UPI000565704B|nr:hypothetical protein [Rhizobium sp. PDO1-076]
MRIDEWLQLSGRVAIFDESRVEASHNRLASTLSPQLEALAASVDLIKKALLHQDVDRIDPKDHADYLAVSQLGFRVFNDVGAATKLLDCGYFVQAASLLRDLSEIGMLALHFSVSPQDVARWRSLDGRQQYDRFGPRALRESLKLKFSDKLSYLDQRFRLFSNYGTHPSTTSIIAHHDGDRFHVGPHFNENIYINTYRDLADLAWHVTDACGDAYCAIFNTSVADILPAETQRFQQAWNRIAPPKPKE